MTSPRKTPPARPDRFLGLLVLDDSGSASSSSSLSRRLSAAAGALEVLLLEELHDACRRRRTTKSRRRRREERPSSSSSQRKEQRRDAKRQRRERRAAGYAADDCASDETEGLSQEQQSRDRDDDEYYRSLRTWFEASSSAATCAAASTAATYGASTAAAATMACSSNNNVHVTTEASEGAPAPGAEEQQRQNGGDDASAASSSAAPPTPLVAGIFLGVPKRKRGGQRKRAKKAEQLSPRVRALLRQQANPNAPAVVQAHAHGRDLPPQLLPPTLKSSSNSVRSSIHPDIDLSLVQHVTAGTHLPGGFMDVGYSIGPFSPSASSTISSLSVSETSNAVDSVATVPGSLDGRSFSTDPSSRVVTPASAGESNAAAPGSGSLDGQSTICTEPSRVVTPAMTSEEQRQEQWPRKGPVRLSHPVSLDEALAFSDCARLVIEAEPKHNVAHLNAAYMNLALDAASSPQRRGAGSATSKSCCVVGHPLPKADKVERQLADGTDEKSRKDATSNILDLVARRVVAPIFGSSDVQAEQTAAVAVVHPIRPDGAPSMGSPWLCAGGLSPHHRNHGVDGATHYLVEFVPNGGVRAARLTSDGVAAATQQYAPGIKHSLDATVARAMNAIG